MPLPDNRSPRPELSDTPAPLSNKPRLSYLVLILLLMTGVVYRDCFGMAGGGGSYGSGRSSSSSSSNNDRDSDSGSMSDGSGGRKAGGAVPIMMAIIFVVYMPQR